MDPLAVDRHYQDLVRHQPGFSFDLQITLWLWFTVLFANFAESIAEGRHMHYSGDAGMCLLNLNSGQYVPE